MRNDLKAQGALPGPKHPDPQDTNEALSTGGLQDRRLGGPAVRSQVGL